MSKYKQKSASAAGATALIGDFGADSQCTTTVFGRVSQPLNVKHAVLENYG